MRKNNKKGFTLIELLAVIIILGVIMLIAVPSVTRYIQQSRKKAYVSTASQYVSSVVNMVNSGDLKFYESNTLYLVKVGHNGSCVKLERGGQSPFSNTWKYAYVGVVYTGMGYDYFFMGEDGTGQGIALTRERNLIDTNYNSLVVTNTPDYEGLYGCCSIITYTIKDGELKQTVSGEEQTVTKGFASDLVNTVNSKLYDYRISKIVVININDYNCTYS